MNPKKDAGRALILSALIPGAGQVYNGQYGKALFFFATWIFILLWPLAIIDAWETATKINEEAYAQQAAAGRAARTARAS